MREYERIARDRYLHDPKFHNIVTLIENLMKEMDIDPNSFHDAVNLAAEKVNHFRIKRNDELLRKMYTEAGGHSDLLTVPKNCHICGKEPQFYCDGCQKLACEDHFIRSLCDTCMNDMESMTEEERAALDRECIELLERGQLP